MQTVCLSTFPLYEVYNHSSLDASSAYQFGASLARLLVQYQDDGPFQKRDLGMAALGLEASTCTCTLSSKADKRHSNNSVQGQSSCVVAFGHFPVAKCRQE